MKIQKLMETEIARMIQMAVRNVVKESRKSLLLGIGVFVTLSLLLFALGVSNSSGRNLSTRYHDMITGDVAVFWKNVKENDKNDPGRVYFSEFNFKRNAENLKGISALDNFLADNAENIDCVERGILGFGTMDTGRNIAYVGIVGVSKDELARYARKNLVRLVEGINLYRFQYGVYISQEFADKYGLSLGDWIVVDCTNAYGLVNSLDYQVAGIYRNGAPWDSMYLYMTTADALSLLDYPDRYFTVSRIFLKKKETAVELAGKLDSLLVQAGGQLRAEESKETTTFWYTFTDMHRTLLTAFAVILLAITGLGLRSAIRMSLNERAREFGTLRTLGFSRGKITFMLLVEAYATVFIAFASAVILVGAVILVSGLTGLRINGAAAYFFGGEYLYPYLKAADIGIAFLLSTLFALFAVLDQAISISGKPVVTLLSKLLAR